MRKQKGIDGKKENYKIYFIIELLLAILIALGCSLIGMSNLLTVSNDLYPYTSDGMGHMTKVVYIAQQLASGHLPSWFPYWYNGSTTTQYYVPLSYYLMAPIYLVTNNIMLTYKIFCASAISIGGIGVWLFSYKKIGKVCGLFAIIIYCFQPMLLDSLYGAGVVAQAPIIAIMPWFLLASLSCVRKPSRMNFVATTMLTVLLILSHAMNAFIICLTTAIVFLIFVFIRKVTLRNLIITGFSILFAGILTAFWSLVGATKLENPNIPYLLPESSFCYTANIHWYIPGDTKAVLHFSYITSIFIIASALIYMISLITKKMDEQLRYYGSAVILLSFTTVVFSFGMNLPGFKYLPMATSLVAGRILTYTSVTAAICSAFTVYELWNFHKVKWIFRIFCLLLIILSSWQMNPLKKEYNTISSDNFEKMTGFLDTENSAFNKGRYQWYSAVNSTETFFPVLYDYNISDGWNIEGTVHNKTIWNNNIAFTLNYYDYIYKQLAFWNIRYLLLSNSNENFSESLEKQSFGFVKQDVNREEDVSLYVSEQPSSYYLIDNRNALIISDEMQGLSITFPNLVQGTSKYLTDYTIQELMKYKLIYIIEPTISTQTQKTDFESMVTKLVNAGVTVMIEPAASKTFELFDVGVNDESIKNSPVFTPTDECPYNLENDKITNNSNLRMIRSLYGLDKVYADYEFDNGKIKNAVLGTKKVGNGEVIFVGAHLSQYLEGVYAHNNGLGSVNSIVKVNSKFIESVYKAMFTYYGVKKDYLPQTFETVKKQSWKYNGGSFTYQSDSAKEVTVSVTYSPRWTATVDGKAVKVGQCENLITLMLPAGNHRVVLHYGVTIYGKIGYLISIVGLFFFMLVLILWKYIMRLAEHIRVSLRSYFQLYEKEETKQVSKEGISDQAGLSAEESAATCQEIPLSKLADHQITDGEDTNNAAKEQIENAYGEQQDGLEEINDRHAFRETVSENGIKVEIFENDEDERSEQDEVKMKEQKDKSGNVKTDINSAGLINADVKSEHLPKIFEKPELLGKEDFKNYRKTSSQAVIQPKSKQDTAQTISNQDKTRTISNQEATQPISEQDTTRIKSDQNTTQSISDQDDCDIYDEILNQAIKDHEAKKQKLINNLSVKNETDIPSGKPVIRKAVVNKAVITNKLRKAPDTDKLNVRQYKRKRKNPLGKLNQRKNSGYIKLHLKDR